MSVRLSHLRITASAGTGKTSTLVARVTNLFLARPDLSTDHVLLLTFTDKAAREIQDAVRGVIGLARLRTPDDQPDLLKLYDTITVEARDDLAPQTREWLTRAQAERVTHTMLVPVQYRRLMQEPRLLLLDGPTSTETSNSASLRSFSTRSSSRRLRFSRRPRRSGASSSSKWRGPSWRAARASRRSVEPTPSSWTSPPSRSLPAAPP